jgi:hypothetical protein
LQGTNGNAPEMETEMVEVRNEARADMSGNAWCRELRRVLALADQRQVYLDRETLIHSDVRDLQRLAMRLQTPARRLDRPHVWR